MKRAAILVLFALSACRATTGVEQNPFSNRTEAAMAGAKLFREHCAACHGADANGHGVVPSLRTATVQLRSDGSLFQFITDGNLRDGMPSWSRLTEQRRWQIISYLRSLAPNQSADQSSSVISTMVSRNPSR